MSAASSLRACGSGLSTTLFASGSRKSILATRGSLPAPLLHNGGMPPELAARRDRIVARLRKIRVWLLLIVGGGAVALLPWTAYLSAATGAASAAAPRPTSPPDRPAAGQEPARRAGSEAPSAGRTSR